MLIGAAVEIKLETIVCDNKLNAACRGCKPEIPNGYLLYITYKTDVKMLILKYLKLRDYGCNRV